MLVGACSANALGTTDTDSDDSDGHPTRDTSTCGDDTGSGAPDLFAGFTFAGDGMPVSLPGDFEVKLGRDGCMGACPSYSITATGDGAVRWDGASFVDTKGVATSTVSVDTLRALVRTLHKGDLETYRTQYGFDTGLCASVWTDAPGVALDLQWNGLHRSVYYYYGCMFCRDDQLDALMSAVDRALGSSVWIGAGGDTGGPF